MNKNHANSLQEPTGYVGLLLDIAADFAMKGKAQISADILNKVEQHLDEEEKQESLLSLGELRSPFNNGKKQNI